MKTLKYLMAICAVFIAPVIAKPVLPDVITQVKLSNSDTNRIVCANGEMNDVFYSSDKVQEVPLNGKYGFIKFPIMKRGSQLSYVTKRSEFHFICNGQAYTIIALPDDIPAQVIYLGSSLDSNVQKNLEMMGSMPKERQSIYLTLKALKNEIPPNFKVTAIEENWTSDLIKGAKIRLIRSIRVDGIGVRLKEYLIKSNQKQYLDEKRFIRPEISLGIRAITVDPLLVEKGQTARIFVIEDYTN
ncbi:TraK domain-containing protein [Pseudoalteromonas luteoviolacea]|uniref:TraK domain-containing protein n=1 Tax=Pseudoalteromonas luteoviolacea TaxID=43657 RepID=UPI001B3774CB|nr:type-F conjugative transfer system secretin TraK [Pseudoalteromonas luteoviolacea]MBQ4839838.1 type-F conjugative transfer system secretin TraK [Pseudoalteromonas luteoviolacea]